MRSLVRIRLQRWGRHKLPVYRIVAALNTTRRNGKNFEVLGTYHPMPISREDKENKTKRLELNVQSVKRWLAHGAQVTPPVEHLLGMAGILPMPPYKGPLRHFPMHIIEQLNPKLKASLDLFEQQGILFRSTSPENQA